MSKKASIDWNFQKDVSENPKAVNYELKKHVHNSQVHLSSEDRASMAKVVVHVNDDKIHVSDEDRAHISTAVNHANNASVHVTPEDKARWDGRKKAWLVSSIAERDALTGMEIGDVCGVGTGDINTVIYVWKGLVWDEDSNIDAINVEWESITGKPDFDALYAAKNHTHDNMYIAHTFHVDVATGMLIMTITEGSSTSVDFKIENGYLIEIRA